MCQPIQQLRCFAVLLRRGQWNEDGAEDAAIKAVANSTPNGSAALLARIDAKLAVGGGPDRWLGERDREAAAAEAAARAAEEEAARAAAQAAAPTPEVTPLASLRTQLLATTLTVRNTDGAQRIMKCGAAGS